MKQKHINLCNEMDRKTQSQDNKEALTKWDTHIQPERRAYKHRDRDSNTRSDRERERERERGGGGGRRRRGFAHIQTDTHTHTHLDRLRRHKGINQVPKIDKESLKRSLNQLLKAPILFFFLFFFKYTRPRSVCRAVPMLHRAVYIGVKTKIFLVLDVSWPCVCLWG